MISPRPRSMPSSTRTGAPSPDPAAHWTRYLERADAEGTARARFWLAKAALAAGDTATADTHLQAAAAAAPWGYYGLRAAALLAGGRPAPPPPGRGRRPPAGTGRPVPRPSSRGGPAAPGCSTAWPAPSMGKDRRPRPPAPPPGSL